MLRALVGPLALALSLLSPVVPQVRGGEAGGLWEVEGTLSVRASPEQAWKVLTDFDHLGCFVPSIEKSEVVKQTPEGLLLEQKLRGQVAFFSREVTVVLEVQEAPYRAIAFRDVSGKDFDFYRGTWLLAGTEGGTKLVYRLYAKPKLPLPAALGEASMKGQVQELLADVGREIDRRAAVH